MLGRLFLPEVVCDSVRSPEYQTLESGCFDVSVTTWQVNPLQPRGPSKGAASYTSVTVPPVVVCATGLRLRDTRVSRIGRRLLAALGVVPVLVLRSRSGLAYKYGVRVLAGEIDADYRDEIKVILDPVAVDAFVDQLSEGDRVAQARWTISWRAPGAQVKLEVRDGGLGSTGK